MRCDYFERGECRSCTLIEQPYDEQVAAKQAATAALLAPFGVELSTPVLSAEAGFRTKAKMVVGGTVDDPVLGLARASSSPRSTPSAREVYDLSGCPITDARVRAAFEPIKRLFVRARVEPYDVAARRGEAKLVIVQVSPDAELMIRLVMRSRESELRLRKHLPQLLAELPSARVVTMNLQPEHKAVMEGPVELALTDETTLSMRLRTATLSLKPRSFFQTNTAVTEALYAQAREWVRRAAPRTALDLYCGVGGFALSIGDLVERVHGIEVSEDAIDSAREAAASRGLTRATFAVGDARSLELGDWPELVIVNPPRRGIGAELADAIDAAPGVEWLIYSSCNPETLAADLARLGSFEPVDARMFDMFAHTGHAEVAVLLRRLG